MIAAANLVEVAALVGDTARATMLAALMGGQWLTATELAYRANVSRSTASGHLSKLVTGRLITVTRKRRFSYYRIASPLVATMLESIKVVAAIEVPPRHQPRSSTRRCTPLCPKLLRSPGWQARRRYYRCASGHGAHLAH
jgi:DNA-binding transcriptional ArsR family regulator